MGLRLIVDHQGDHADSQLTANAVTVVRLEDLSAHSCWRFFLAIRDTLRRSIRSRSARSSIALRVRVRFFLRSGMMVEVTSK